MYATPSAMTRAGAHDALAAARSRRCAYARNFVSCSASANRRPRPSHRPHPHHHPLRSIARSAFACSPCISSARSNELRRLPALASVFGADRRRTTVDAKLPVSEQKSQNSWLWCSCRVCGDKHYRPKLVRDTKFRLLIVLLVATGDGGLERALPPRFGSVGRNLDGGLPRTVVSLLRSPSRSVG